MRRSSRRVLVALSGRQTGAVTSFCNTPIADAILDRLVHNARRLILKGDSMRKLAAKQSGRLDANVGMNP